MGSRVDDSRQCAYQKALSRKLAACDDETCVSGTIEEHDLIPNYVYVPKGQLTKGAAAQMQDEAICESMVESDRYELVYENDGVMVFCTINY